MHPKQQEGYVLVAVLIVIAILSTVATIGLRQFTTTARASQLDGMSNAVDYQALGALNRGWELVAANLQAGSVVPAIPLPAGTCLPDARPTDPAQIEPLTVTVHNDETGQDEPFAANQRAWIYQTTLCNPAQAPSTSIGTATGGSITANRYYHFRYTWENSQSKQTAPSDASTVYITTGQKPAFQPPDADFSVTPPIGAVRYKLYVASTTTPTAPTSSSSYRLVNLVSQTRVCSNNPQFRCLVTMPSSGANPPATNSAEQFIIVAKGWDGDEAAPKAERYLMGAVLTEPSDYRIYFPNAW